jgi:hypothetical protein
MFHLENTSIRIAQKPSQNGHTNSDEEIKIAKINKTQLKIAQSNAQSSLSSETMAHEF